MDYQVIHTNSHMALRRNNCKPKQTEPSPSQPTQLRKTLTVKEHEVGTGSAWPNYQKKISMEKGDELVAAKLKVMAGGEMHQWQNHLQGLMPGQNSKFLDGMLCSSFISGISHIITWFSMRIQRILALMIANIICLRNKLSLLLVTCHELYLRMLS